MMTKSGVIQIAIDRLAEAIKLVNESAEFARGAGLETTAFGLEEHASEMGEELEALRVSHRHVASKGK